MGLILAILLLATGCAAPAVQSWQTISPTLPPTATPRPTPSPPFPGGTPLDPAAIERLVIAYTNEVREEHGLTPLEQDPEISEIARDHSAKMVTTGILSHEIDGEGATDRALAAGYDCRAYDSDGTYTYGLAENISLKHRVKQWQGRGTDWEPVSYLGTAQAVAVGIVEDWMDSPGHRENILSARYKRIGVGVEVEVSSKYGWRNEIFYTTQNFSSCR